MKKLLLLLLLLLPVAAFAQPTVGNGCTANPSSANPLTCDITISITNTQTIYIDASYFSQQITSATDTVGGVTTNLTPACGTLANSTQPYPNPSLGGFQSFFLVNKAAIGTHTISINYASAADFPSMTVVPIDGVDTTQNPVEGCLMANSPAISGGILSVGSATTITPNAIIVMGGDVSAGGATISPISGWTQTSNPPQGNQAVTYIVKSTPGTYPAQQSVSRDGDGWAGNVVILKAAPTSGSLIASPTSVSQNTTGNVITLTGVGTSWTSGTPGSPTFTITGGPTITSQTVTSSTTATVTISTGTTNGTFAINDPSTGNSALVQSTPITACVATDSFGVDGPLGSNWQNTTVTSASNFGNAGNPDGTFTVSALNISGGIVTPLTSSTLGSANWIGSSCTPPDNQYSQMTLSSTPTTNAFTGPAIRMHPDGRGYILLVAVASGSSNVGTIEELKAGMIGVHSIAPTCGVGLPTSGDTFKIAIIGNDIYGYKNGAQVCHGVTNDDIVGGAPGMYVDQSLSPGGADSASSFEGGSTPLQPVTFNYISDSYDFSPALEMYTASRPLPWQANQPYVLNYQITDQNGIVETITTPGKSGSTLPTTWGTTTNDGTAVWTKGVAAKTVICYARGGAIPKATLAGTCDSDGTTQTYSNPITISSTDTITAISTEVGLTNASSTSVTLTITGSSPVTYYVNSAIGGDRYSTNQTAGLCDGTANLAPVGTTPNQHCAFSDVRYLWQDGSVANGLLYPAWGWIGAGGDHYVIEGTIASGAAYRVGPDNVGATCGSTACWGIAGDPSSSGPPPIHSGGPSNHTTFEGQNYGACSSMTDRTPLFGGWAAGHTFNVSGSSYVDIGCLDLSDHDACSVSGGTTGANHCTNGTNDYAATGLAMNNQSHDITFNDLYIHGFGSAGISGPTGGHVTFNNLGVFANGFSGWNADVGDGTTGFGSLVVTNFNISWNGCVEEYPIVDPIPVNWCTNDSNGGYGDGWGTTTTSSGRNGWQVLFKGGVASYNTQDGLDALHITGEGSTVEEDQVLAYSNMGNQLKVGGAAATMTNDVIVGNCDAITGNNNLIVGLPSDFNVTGLGSNCRGGNNAVAITITSGTTATFQYNTVYYPYVAVELEYGNNDHGPTNVVKMNNNIFFGSSAAAPFVSNGGAVPAVLEGVNSSWTNNDYFSNGSWTCPNAAESAALCVDPQLTTSTYPLVGPPADATPTLGSPVVGTGTPISGITTDYNGTIRPNPPSMGAIDLVTGIRKIFRAIKH